jgi:hypothetical protein
METTDYLKLRKIGYSKEYLNQMNNPEFTHVRFTFEELVFLESLVGKKIKTSTGNHTIVNIDPSIVGCAMYYNHPNGLKGVIHIEKQNGILVAGRSKTPLKNIIF